MKNNEILTLGYEKRSIESFIKILKNAEVKVLADVRDYPKSRKNGFSKSELINTFSQNGIKYIHLKELGSPPKIRKKLIKDGNYNYFFKKYKDYLVKQEKTIQNLSIIVKENKTCIFCYEKDFNKCHRKTITAYLNLINNGYFDIKHL